MSSDLQLERVARDLTEGLDPTVSRRVNEHFAAASKELQKAGMKIKEGSMVKGIGTGSDFMGEFGGEAYDNDIKPDTKKKMMRDPDVNFAMQALAGPISGSEWAIECSDGDIAAFLEGALRPVWAPFISAAVDAVAYGFQAFEKVYVVKDVEIRTGEKDEEITVVSNAVTYKELFDVDPSKAEFVIKKGELAGFKCGKVTIEIDPSGETIDKGAVVTMPRVRWGDYSGEGRLEQCYDPWWAKVNTMQFMLRYLERLGDPPIIGRAPKGTSQGVDAVSKDNLDVMLDTCKTVRGHGVVVLPFDIDLETKEQKWQISLLEDDMRQAVFLEVLEHLSILIMRACLQPEKRLIEGKSVGAYAMVQVQSGVADMISLNLQKILFEQISQQILPPLVLANFGPTAPPARIVPGAMSQENMDVLTEVLKMIVEYEKGNLPENPLTSMIDQLKLLKQLRIPTRESEEQESEADPGTAEVEETPDQTEEAPPQEESQEDMSIRLATPRGSRQKYEREISKRAAAWKENVADPILEEQLASVNKQLDKAFGQKTRASQVKAIREIEVPSGPYQKALQEYLEDSHHLGRQAAAEQFSVNMVADIPAADKQLLSATAQGLAEDRAQNVKRVANVAALQGVKIGQTAKEVQYEIRKRVEKRLKNRSNKVTAVAEGWRGFHSGKLTGAVDGAPKDDPIVAVEFIAQVDPCPFCEDLGGQIVTKDNPAFFAYLPPQHHNCVCDVVYIKKSEFARMGEVPEFERPPQEHIDRYADEYFVPKELLSTKCGPDHDHGEGCLL